MFRKEALVTTCCKKDVRREDSGKIISWLLIPMTHTFLLHKEVVLHLRTSNISSLLSKGNFELPIHDEREVSPNLYFQILLILQLKYLQQISSACSNADKVNDHLGKIEHWLQKFRCFREICVFMKSRHMLRNLKSDHFVNKCNNNAKRPKHSDLYSVVDKEWLLMCEVFLSLPIVIWICWPFENKKNGKMK